MNETDTDLGGPYSGGNFDFSYPGGNEAYVTFRAFIDFSRAAYSNADKARFEQLLSRAVDNWDNANAVVIVTDLASGASKPIRIRFRLQKVSRAKDANKKVDVHPEGTSAIWFHALAGMKDREVVVRDMNLYISHDRRIQELAKKYPGSIYSNLSQQQKDAEFLATLTHEFGHVWGLEDEYKANWFEAAFSPAQVHPWYKFGFGTVPEERDVQSVMHSGSVFKPRHFEHFARRLRKAFKKNGFNVKTTVVV